MEDLYHEKTELLNEIYNFKQQLKILYSKLENVVGEIQQNCEHNWEIELSMCEKRVYCNKCNLIDWDRSKCE